MLSNLFVLTLDYTGKSCQLLKDFCTGTTTCLYNGMPGTGGTCTNQEAGGYKCTCQSGRSHWILQLSSRTSLYTITWLTTGGLFFLTLTVYYWIDWFLIIYDNLQHSSNAIITVIHQNMDRCVQLYTVVQVLPYKKKFYRE